MNIFLLGMICMGFLVAGLFFLRFWRETGDRLFLIFALAFWLFALGRVFLILVGGESEPRASAAQVAKAKGPDQKVPNGKDGKGPSDLDPKDEERVEAHTFIYLLRLAGFLCIILAIVDKNRGRRKPE